MTADWSAVAADAERVAAQRETAHFRRQLVASPAGVALRNQRPGDLDDAIADAMLERLDAYAETQVRRNWRQHAIGSWAMAALIAGYGFVLPALGLVISLVMASFLVWSGAVFWRARADADDAEVAKFRANLVARVIRGEWPVPDNLNKSLPLDDWQKAAIGLIVFVGAVMVGLPIFVAFG